MREGIGQKVVGAAIFVTLRLRLPAKIQCQPAEALLPLYCTVTVLHVGHCTLHTVHLNVGPLFLGRQVVPKCSTNDLSVSYVISSKRLLFENIAHDGSFQHCIWLYLTVHGCTRL